MAFAVLFLAALAFSAVASIPAPLQVIDMPMQCQNNGITGHCATVEECPHSDTSDEDSSRSRTCQRYGMVCCLPPTSQRQTTPMKSEGTSASEDSSAHEDAVDRGLTEFPGPGDALYNPMCQEKNNQAMLANQNCCGREVPSDDINDITSSANRIYGGERAKREQHPWMVRIFQHIRTVLRSSCSGVLIGARHVLTARHCHNEDVKSVGLGCGFNETAPHKCEKQIYVAKIEPGRSADIMIVELLESAPFTDTIRPICLPSAAEPAHLVSQRENRMYSIAGWGKTENETKSKYKMHAMVPHVPSEKCEQDVQQLCTNGAGNVDICRGVEGKICAGGDGKDPCVGDSGGPLMLKKSGRFETVGIITSQTKKRKSNGEYSCGERGVPSLYLDLSAHLKWIKEYLKD